MLRSPLTEAAVLYWLLFLSALVAPAPAASFSVAGELNRAGLYALPALLLVMLCLNRDGLLGEAGFRAPVLPSDLAWAAIALAGLIISAVGVAGLFSLVPGYSGLSLKGPTGVGGYAAAAAASIVTGYFEEGFFRVYLYRRLRDAGTGTAIAVGTTTLLFALCHRYEGLAGMLSAAISGLVLSLVFLRRPSVHPVAWAHGAYNLFAWLSVASS